MARPVKTEKDNDTTTDTVAKEEEVYHIRLKSATMYMEPALGLDLNALQDKRTGTVPKNLPKDALLKLSQAIHFNRVERYDPNMPEMTEPPPKKKKDLTRTNEQTVLNHPDEAEIIRYIEMVAERKARGVLSLKIMWLLETDGKNPALTPRANIVDILSAKLRDQGITKPALTEIEVEGIVVMNSEPGEIVSVV
jgi:hypothetical protein